MSMRNILPILILLLAGISGFGQTADERSAQAEQFNKQAVAFFNKGDYKAALPAAVRARELYATSSAKDKPAAAIALTNLGHIYLRLEETDNAIKAFDEALSIYEKASSESKADRTRFAVLLETAAVVRALEKKYDRAAEHLIKAVELREKINGPNSAETAETLDKLGQIYRVTGDYELALQKITRSMEIKKSLAKPVSPESVFTTVCMLDTLGRNDEAKELQKGFITGIDDELSSTSFIDLGVSGKARSLPMPVMPRNVQRIDTQVDVRVLLDEQGVPILACAVSGRKGFTESAEAAAYSARFEPATLGGKPVKAMAHITYSYKF